MIPAALFAWLADAAIVALLAASLGVALGARALTKRALGLAGAYFAGGLWLAAAGAGELAAALVAALGFAAAGLGLAIAVRVQEAYGVADAAEAARSDEREEEAERAS